MLGWCREARCCDSADVAPGRESGPGRCALENHRKQQPHLGVGDPENINLTPTSPPPHQHPTPDNQPCHRSGFWRGNGARPRIGSHSPNIELRARRGGLAWCRKNTPPGMGIIACYSHTAFHGPRTRRCAVPAMGLTSRHSPVRYWGRGTVRVPVDSVRIVCRNCV